MGWKVNRQDLHCHEGRCLIRVCKEAEVYGLQIPSISKFESGSTSAVLRTTILDKTTFLRSWLFFRVLVEIYTLSGLVVDQNVLSFPERLFNTSYLDGLPLKPFPASQRSRRAGTKNWGGSCMRLSDKSN
jgi:hypothetical protein